MTRRLSTVLADIIAIYAVEMFLVHPVSIMDHQHEALSWRESLQLGSISQQYTTVGFLGYDLCAGQLGKWISLSKYRPRLPYPKGEEAVMPSHT